MRFQTRSLRIAQNSLVLLVLLVLSPYPAVSQEDSVDRDYSSELPRIAPLGPSEALESFETADGFRMELAAAEPLVRDPIAMAFDERGRLFVVEMRGYSEQRDQNLGAVRLLTDENGDGVFDTATNYVQGLAWPTAVACYDGGVFVGVAPDILYCKDTDGDGKADRIERVYTGFSLQNVQGLLNSFNWGVDNRIHGSASSSGGAIKRVDGSDSEAISVRGRDFSFDPRTLEFRTESGGAQHGLTFDDWGRKFVCSNSDHVQQILFDERYAARTPWLATPNARASIAVDGPQADVFRISPVEPWRIVRTRLRVKGVVRGPIEGGGTAAGYFTSATGITIYRGDAWPQEHRGLAIIGDVGGNLIHRKRVGGDGIRLESRRIDEQSEFVASRDIWFRPVQFCNGPDGTLYVADMYREVIEHPDSLPPVIKKHLDLTSGHDRGRIYRIVADGFEPRQMPDLGEYASEDLVSLLSHPNAWHHETASRLLWERQDRSVVSQLRETVRNGASSIGRARALAVLKGLGQVDERTVVAALNDSDPLVRYNALRVAELLARSQEVAATMANRIVDSNSHVRYQAAFSMGEVPGPERIDALTRAVKDAENDPLLRFAIATSLNEGSSAVLANIATDSEYLSSAEGRNAFRYVAALVGSTGDDAERRKALDALDSLSNASLVRDGVAAMVDGALERGVSQAREWVASSLLEDPRFVSMVEDASKTARDESAPLRDRKRSLRLAAALPFSQAGEIYSELLERPAHLEIHSEVLQALRTYSEPQAAFVILARWRSLTPAAREIAGKVLMARNQWLPPLFDAVNEGRISRSDLDPDFVTALQQHRNEEIRAQAATIFGAHTAMLPEEIDKQYESARKLVGNNDQGRLLFTEHCSKCHTFKGEGFEVGPSLDGIANRGADTILVNLVDPNREINSGYTNYIVETRDGQILTGIIASESATTISLKRANEETDSILRMDVRELRSSNLSIMPQDFAEVLTPQELADIVAYLMQSTVIEP